LCTSSFAEHDRCMWVVLFHRWVCARKERPALCISRAPLSINPPQVPFISCSPILFLSRPNPSIPKASPCRHTQAALNSPRRSAMLRRLTKQKPHLLQRLRERIFARHLRSVVALRFNCNLRDVVMFPSCRQMESSLHKTRLHKWR
jgi:hypothetical protein